MKCSECYRKWCPERDIRKDECYYVDKEVSGKLAIEMSTLIVNQIKEKQ